MDYWEVLAQKYADHRARTGKCFYHYSIDEPPLFCEACGKDWKAVVDGRDGRRKRRARRAS